MGNSRPSPLGERFKSSFASLINLLTFSSSDQAKPILLTYNDILTLRDRNDLPLPRLTLSDEQYSRFLAELKDQPQINKAITLLCEQFIEEINDKAVILSLDEIAKAFKKFNLIVLRRAAKLRAESRSCWGDVVETDGCFMVVCLALEKYLLSNVYSS